MKLDKEVAEGSIICLQEVSKLWGGKLHQYFANRGYYMVTSLYGNIWNGYMGVATAVPLKDYEILAVDITKIADTKKMIKKPKPTLIQKVIAAIHGHFLYVAKLLGMWKPPFDVWKESLRRSNEVVTVRLQSKSGGRPFVLGTYHMPCAFWSPQMMMIHCALSTQHIQRLAKTLASDSTGGSGTATASSAADPYIFVGDFNIKPESTMYRMITKGCVEAGNPDLPPIDQNDPWECKVNPMGSAYATAQGSEPAYTNWSKVKQGEDFKDTLDYIFYSQGDWRVDTVEDLRLSELVGPFPIEEEPSDHVLLSATLTQL